MDGGLLGFFTKGSMKFMEQMLNRMLWGQLHAAGFLGRGHDPRSLMEQTDTLRAPHRRWMRESLDVLTRAGFLIRTDEGYAAATAPPDAAELWEQWDRMSAGWLADPDLAAQARLAERTLRALPDILAGRVKATEILFPGGTMELVEGIYKHNRTADYYNGVLGDMIEAYMEEVAADRRTASGSGLPGIRILEVGAGTGGTSAEVFRRLRPYRELVQEYCYTDMSKAFLAHAQRAYGSENPYLNCRILNAELPYREQGLECGAYDLVIAANVLHATANIRRTLRNCKAALKQNGLLLLNEITSNTVFAHVTFGLLDGWWLYEDDAVRIPGSPCLGEDEWKRALEDEGFRSVLFAADGSKGQQIIVSESDGYIRQPAEAAVSEISEQRSGAARPMTAERSAGAANSLSPELTAWAAHAAHPARTQAEMESRPAATTNAGTRSSASKHIAAPDEVRAYVRTAIRDQLEQSLQLTPDMIDDGDAFSDYGLDSITGIQLVKGLNQALGCKLSITDIFDYSSVRQLAGHLVERYASLIKLPEQAADPMKSDANVGSAAADDRTFHVPESFDLPVRHSHANSITEAAVHETAVPHEFAASGKSTDAKLTYSENGHGGTPPVKGPIAVIGLSGRFAGAEDVRQLWAHLAAGDDLVKEVTRWNLREAFPDREPFAMHGGFLERIDEFDAAFFNIPDQEADYMDPQQRIFLEEAWKALEDAGYAGESVEGRRCGVYVGCQNSDYQLLYGGDAPSQALWGMSPSLIPSRIAYYLDLQGPAIAVDTACSSSLVAIHLACQGLWTGDTEMALAGGVSVRLTPDFHETGTKAGLLSAQGRCFAFDDRADGFVLSEGAGAVVLKRLEDAVADGDHIYGVIQGSGMNQDGRTNGITAPSPKSQERLARGVYADFGIDPSTIQLVEAHGTGTQLGDAIEVEALSRVFRSFTTATGFCAIGSLKSNIGHTATASGVAGLIKLLLSMQKGQMPPTLHYEKGNANIDFGQSPFYVNTRLTPWAAPAGGKRRAALSAFGLNGTNAHLVVEEAPSRPLPAADGRSRLIALSARTADQLRMQAERLSDYIRREQPEELANMSYTLLTGRKQMGHRLACAVRTPSELLHSLDRWLAAGSSEGIYVSEAAVRSGANDEAGLRLGRECLSRVAAASTGEDCAESLRTLARLYAEGCPLPYGELFRDGRYTRVPLPVYPLAKDRHWVPEREPDRAAAYRVSAEGTNAEPIAIIGRSGTFPSPIAATANDLRRQSAFRPDRCEELRKTDPSRAEFGAAASGSERFDPQFFGLSEEQARDLRPLHRLLLIHGWKAVEAAGYAPGTLAGSRTAVFVGAPSGAACEAAPHPMNGANWLSWLLDLRGPSETIDTAGSSALSAIDRAVRALRSGECETALVGGASARDAVAESGILEAAAAAEDADNSRLHGSGYEQLGPVGGTSVGMLLLKRLSAAERDGDAVCAVIRASAVAHTGRSQTYAAPSVSALSELLESAYVQGVDPDAVAFMEVDGTDFGRGGRDAWEELEAAYRENSRTAGNADRQEPQFASSMADHDGHAAGMASVMNVLDMFARRQTAGSKTDLDLDRAEDRLQSWKPIRDEDGRELPSLAGMTAFGRGGVNACVVVEEYAPRPRAPKPSIITPEHPGVFLLSAKNETSLRAQAADLAAAVSMLPEEKIDDVSFTLQTGRDAMEARLAIVAGSFRELTDKLEAYLSGRSEQDGIYEGLVSPDNAAVRLLAMDDEDCGELVRQWLAKRKFARLLPLWVQGLGIAWTSLHGNGETRPSRVSLPTYPFRAAEERNAEPSAGSPAAALASYQ